MTPSNPGADPRAACQDIDPDLFFPLGYGATYRALIDVAKSMCSGCLLRRPCLDYAVTTGQGLGIWGGLTPKERMATARRTAALTDDTGRHGPTTRRAPHSVARDPGAAGSGARRRA